MATDYVVRFTGQDNLSGTIKQLKQNLSEVGTSSTKLDQIREKFNKIEASTAPLKKKLRDIKILMADMNLNGLSNTDLFNQMAQSAGNYADAMADASAATNVFANDNFKLEAMAQGLSGIAGAASVATGIMGLMGTENEKVAQAILKVQSVLAILNGVQAVANVLNKDSALMLRLKQIRMAANTASTTANTAATTANTIATTANTTATAASTVAQNAWNVAKAVAKALLGDWTGLVLVGAVALGTYALATDNSTEKIEEQTKATDKAKEAHQKYNEALASNAGNLVGKFKLLQNEWNNLRTTAEKTEWLKQNQTEFKNLGLKVTDLKSAEDVFIKNTKNVVAALEARASAMAAQSMLTDAYTTYYKTIMAADNSVAGGGYYNNVKAGQSYEQGSQAMQDLIRAMKQNGDVTSTGDAYNKDGKYYTMDKGKFVLTSFGAAAINALRSSEASQLNSQIKANAKKELDKVVTFATDKINAANKIINQAGLDFNQGSGSKSTTTTTKPSTTTTTTDNKPEYQAGSLAAEEAKLQDLQKQLKNTKFETQEAMDAAINAVAAQAAKVKQMKIQLGLEVAVDMSDDTITGLTNQIAAIENRLKNEVLSEDERKQLILEKDIKIKAKTTLEIQSGFKDADPVLTRIEQQREAYQDAMEQISQMQQDYKLKIITQDEASDKLAKINEQLKLMGLEPIELYVNAEGIQTASEAMETFKNNMDSVGNAVNSLGSVFNSLGDAIGGTGGKVLELAGNTIQAVAQIIPQIVALMAAKEGEALASGTASAAGLPFPANIAAIASIIATITALFASFAGKFADGGIISGNSFHGDSMLARVNSGEMILNKTQQATLFRALNGAGGIGSGGQVEFKISGSTLTGVLKNYNNKMGKIK